MANTRPIGGNRCARYALAKTLHQATERYMQHLDNEKGRFAEDAEKLVEDLAVAFLKAQQGQHVTYYKVQAAVRAAREAERKNFDKRKKGLNVGINLRK